MGLANFIRRGLNGIARRDRWDRLKGLVLAGVRVANALGARGPASSAADGAARRQAVVKLVQYAFPGWETPILVMGGQVDAFAAAIRAAGYGCCSGSQPARTWPVSASGNAQAGGKSGIVVLVDLLERMDASELNSFLESLQELAPARIVASIPVYPEAIWESNEGGGRPVTLERRGWWEQCFARLGFDTERPPREILPGLSPFLFRRRQQTSAASDAQHRKAQCSTSPRTVFVMPETQNAFRWVTESLADALTGLGHPARVIPPEIAGRAQRNAGTNQIGWAHYWPQYRELAKSVEPAYEVFVTNFEIARQGDLTPWVAELCARPSVKLAVSNYCWDVLVGLGVPQDRVRVVPHGYSPEFASPPAPLPLATRKTFRLLAVVNSHDPYRYGTDILLAAYRKAFRENDDVCLVIKDYGANAAATQSWFDDSGGPEILYYANFLEKSDLAAFYSACSAFVAPFRGEGFGMKILDAAVAGLPLVVPLYGGPLAYCVPELVQPVAFERRRVGKCLDTDQIEWKEEIAWCEPSVDDLAAGMRRVFENRSEAAEKAARLRTIAVEQFSWEAAARKLLAIIE